MVWDVATTNGNGEGATITVNGQTSDLTVGGNFKEQVIAKAREYGLGKFRLYINDAETNPQEAPATVVGGMAVKLVPFDVAG